MHAPSCWAKTSPGVHATRWCSACPGSAQWLDKGQQRCLVLWRALAEWADTLHGFARDFGLQDSVMTLDELSSGDEVRGTGVLSCLLCDDCHPSLANMTTYLCSLLHVLHYDLCTIVVQESCTCYSRES